MSLITAPTLHTERLTLRAHVLSDFDACAALWGNPEVVRFIGGKTSTRSESWQRFLRSPGMWAFKGMGYWLAEETRTGAFVGEMGLGDFKRPMDPGFPDGTPEAGWVLTPSQWGKGFAFEGMQAVLGWMDETLRASRSVCVIETGHTVSERLAHKLGFTAYATTHLNGDPCTLYQRERP